MSLTLINSALAAMLALGAVPLLLHLFARSRPPVYDFPGVVFLRRAARKTSRLKKPQEILLLLLRTLFFLALIGAFLRPLWFPREPLTGAFQNKTVIVVVDATASMSLVEGGQTRFAKACAEAGEVLSGLTSRDAANVVWIDTEPGAVFPDGPGENLGYLRDQLRRARSGWGRGSPAAALRLALDQLEGVEGKREICVVSDFQRTAWEEFEPELPSDIELVCVRVGEREPENLAVVSLGVEPPDPVAGESVSVQAEVRNYSPGAAVTTVFSECGESRRSQSVEIEPWGGATLLFDHGEAVPGALRASVSLGEDSFPGDDRRHAVLEVRPFLRVGVWSDGSELGNSTARVWTRACQSLGWAVPETLDTARLASVSDEGFDAIFLAGWDGSLPELDIPDGVLLVCLPAASEPNAAGESLARLLGVSEALSFRMENAGDGEPFRLSVAEADDPWFALFRDGEHGDPGGLAGRRRLVGAGSGLPGTRPLLVWQDNGTAAVSRSAPGRYLWTVPLEESAGNWATRVEFVPLMGELILSSRSEPGTGGTLSPEHEPGETLLWTAPAEIDGPFVATTPDGTEMASSALENRQFLSDAPARATGFYEWWSGSQYAGASVVNFPADAESDLRSLEPHEVEAFAAAVVSGGDGVRRLRDGIPLWPFLLAAAVALIAAESLVGWWSARAP